MALVESLQRAIDFMEAHLTEPVTVEDIAGRANMSPFHFQRTFMILTDISVGDYLRRRRLSLAAQEIVTTDAKIIDLAYKYGYETPEAFSKSFRKQHGVTPSEARKGMGKLQSYSRLIIQVSLKGAEPMKYRVVERSAFRIVGVKREVLCGGEDGSPSEGIGEFWGQANGDGTVQRLLELNRGTIRGVLGVTDNYDAQKNVIDYWIAVETGESGRGSEVGERSTTGEENEPGERSEAVVPGDFADMDLPASRWVVFEVKGPAPAAMVNTWTRIYSEWLPSSGYEFADAAALEAYIDPDPFRSDSLNEIWVAVK